MTRFSHHGLRIVTELSGATKRVPSHEISDLTGVPPGCVPTIVAALSRAGILHNVPGSGGGCLLARDASRITVLDVIEAVEGRPTRDTCMLDGARPHHDPPCALHAAWIRAEEEVLQALRSVTIADLALGRDPFDLRTAGGDGGRPNPSEETA